jgi:undecaprenyl-diphosphatase
MSFIPKAASNRAVLALMLLAGGGAGLLLAAAADRSAFVWLNGALAALPVPLLALLSMLGLGASAMLVMAPALLCAPRIVGAGLFAAPLGLLLTHVPKNLLQLPRPLAVLDPAQVHVVGAALRGANSMPSGHAVTALTVASVAILGMRDPQLRLLRGVLVMAVALAVCLARIAVGAHWPSDVMAGAALGLLNGWFAMWASDHWRASQCLGGHVVFALLVLGCCIDLAQSDAVMPQAWLPRLLLVALGVASVALWSIAVLRPEAGAMASSLPHAGKS